MAHVRWTLRAREDLRAIREYHARESPRFAELLEDALLDAAQKLGIFPRAGRIVPEIGDDAIREMLHRQYRIVYVLVDDETVDILTVFHSSRSFG